MNDRGTGDRKPGLHPETLAVLGATILFWVAVVAVVCRWC